MDLKVDKCGECNGKGYIKYKNHKSSKYYKYSTCDKCKVTGTIDWVERLVGKKESNLIWFSAAGYNRNLKGGLKIKMGNTP